MVLTNKPLPELEPNDCSEIQAENETLRQELSILVLEIRDFAEAIKSGGYDGSLSPEEQGNILLGILSGDDR